MRRGTQRKQRCRVGQKVTPSQCTHMETGTKLDDKNRITVRNLRIREVGLVLSMMTSY